MDAEEREFIALNIRLYPDEDLDIIEYLKGKPKTWLVKEALRFYRDNKGKIPEMQQPAIQIIKDIEYYMSLNYTYKIRLVQNDPNYPDYYFGGFEELEGCHTDAPTIEKLIADLEMVKRDWLEIKLECGGEIPEPEMN